MHIAPYLSRAAVVLAGLLAAALPAMAQPRPQLSITAEPRVLDAPLQADAPQIAALALRARNRGLVRVIARIASPVGVSTGPVSDADLATVQGAFRNRALTLGAAKVEPIANLPLSVIEVDAARLQE